MRSEIFSMPQAGVNRRVTTCLVERDWNGGDIHWRINRNAREKLGGRCALPSGFSPFSSRGSGAVDAVDPPVQLVGFDVLSAQDANPVLLVKQQEVDGRDRTDVFSIFKWYDARVFRTFAAHVRRESTKECGNARATNEFFKRQQLAVLSTRVVASSVSWPNCGAGRQFDWRCRFESFDESASSGKCVCVACIGHEDLLRNIPEGY